MEAPSIVPPKPDYYCYVSYAWRHYGISEWSFSGIFLENESPFEWLMRARGRPGADQFEIISWQEVSKDLYDEYWDKVG